MPAHRPAFGLLLPLALCAACASDPHIDAAQRAQREALCAPRWVLVEMDGAPVGAFEGGPIDLHLESDGRFHGHAGVNRYSGSWKSLRKGELEIRAIAATRRFGPPESMQREKRFLDLLARVERCELEGPRLAMIDEAAARALVFERRTRED